MENLSSLNIPFKKNSFSQKFQNKLKFFFLLFLNKCILEWKGGGGGKKLEINLKRHKNKKLLIPNRICALFLSLRPFVVVVE